MPIFRSSDNRVNLRNLSGILTNAPFTSSLERSESFECAGRIGSLTLAAAELGVTHGAISRQIKLLEDWLGVRLFVKDGRGVILTTEGRKFLMDASRSLDDLSAASENLTGQIERRLLCVNAPQTFTMRWLITRLPSFSAAHPEIEVRLAASITPIGQVADHFDVAVRRGPITSADSGTPFLSETCVPVASPKLLEKAPVEMVSDLQKHILLHAESLADLWPRWLDSVGQSGLRGKAQLRFEPLYHSLQAALDGVGVAMGPSALVADDIAAGRLIPLFPEAELAMNDFYVLVAEHGSHARQAELFKRWLIVEGTSGSLSRNP